MSAVILVGYGAAAGVSLAAYHLEKVQEISEDLLGYYI